MSLYETIGERAYTTLLADPEGAERIAVAMKPEMGTLLPGTVICRGDDGEWVAAGTGDMTGSKSLAVLDEHADTGTLDLAGPTKVARAFRSGKFVRSAVNVGGDALTAAQELVLRQQGIVMVPLNGDVMPEADNEPT